MQVAKVNIGGQAVLEGIMMKGKSHYAVAVRKLDKSIVVDTKDSVSIMDRIKIFKWPLLRGVAVFIESLVLGVKTLSYSAELYGEEEIEEAPSKFEMWLSTKLGDMGEKIIMALVMVLSFALSIGLFMVLPMLISSFLKRFIDISLVIQNIIEGIIRIGLFLAYMKVITKVKDIKRTFEYHGAEHKCINCLEQDLPLTVENVKSCSRLHKSCGTSFLFVVMIVSILVYSVFSTEVVWQRILIRIGMLPVIAGLAYEFIRWARIKSDNKLAHMLSQPGMWLQRVFTTEEPDEQQIEVAIAAVEGVLKYEPIE